MMDRNEIYDFMLSVMTDMEEQGHYSTAHVYRYALNAALAYGGDSLCLEELTPAWLADYQVFLLKQELSWNTISTYMRMLRAVYNRAVDTGLVSYIPRQFKGVFTGRHVNHQRALGKNEIRTVLSAEVDVAEADVTEVAVAEAAEPAESSEAHLSRRDLRWARACLELMLRFHGMPFIDLAHLRKTDLRNGRLTIRRHKTGMPLSVAVDSGAMKLLGCYANTDRNSPYLLDILDGNLSGRAAYENYQRVLRLLNLRLSQLSCQCGVRKRVSSYSARHTWATTAKYCGVSVEVISEALGHASISTTEGYLKQFDDRKIEKANKVIMNYIFG